MRLSHSILLLPFVFFSSYVQTPSEFEPTQPAMDMDNPVFMNAYLIAPECKSNVSRTEHNVYSMETSHQQVASQ